MSENKKKRSWLTPWIIAGACLLALFIYLWILRNRELPPKPELARPESSSTPRSNEVATYISFVRDSGARMSLDHTFTSEALTKLAGALTAVDSGNNTGDRSAPDSVRTLAGMITRDPYETSHADHIRHAADIAVRFLEQIQEAEYPGLAGEMVAMRNAAELIDPDRLTLDQREEVKNFFRQTAVLLQKLN